MCTEVTISAMKRPACAPPPATETTCAKDRTVTPDVRSWIISSCRGETCSRRSWWSTCSVRWCIHQSDLSSEDPTTTYTAITTKAKLVMTPASSQRSTTTTLMTSMPPVKSATTIIMKWTEQSQSYWIFNGHGQPQSYYNHYYSSPIDMSLNIHSFFCLCASIVLLLQNKICCKT